MCSASTPPAKDALRTGFETRCIYPRRVHQHSQTRLRTPSRERTERPLPREGNRHKRIRRARSRNQRRADRDPCARASRPHAQPARQHACSRDPTKSPGTPRSQTASVHYASKGGEGMDGGGPSRSPGYPPGESEGRDAKGVPTPCPPAVHPLPTPTQSAHEAASDSTRTAEIRESSITVLRSSCSHMAST